MKRILLTIAIILALPVSIFSLNEKIVGDITIRGLKRTKTHIVLETIELESGDSLGGLTPEDLEQRLLKAGIFNPGEISFTEHEDLIDIDIEVYDKWTLLPIPLFSFNQDEQSFSGLIYEQNLFGLKKQLLIGGGYSTKNGASGVFQYVDKFFYFGGSYTRNSDEEFHNINGSVGIQKEWNKFHINTSLLSSYYNYDNVKNKYYMRVPIFLEYAKKHYSDTIQTGYSVSLVLNPGFDFTESTAFYRNDFRLWYEINPINKLFFSIVLTNRTNFVTDPSEFIETWGNKETSRTLKPVDATDFTGFSVASEYILGDFNWGAISTILSWEIGGYGLRENNDFNGYKALYTGPAAGLRVYLKGLAIPALGIDYGYNIIDNKHNISLTLGLGM